MTEPTDAEIQAAMEAVTADATSRLPDHDHEVVTSVVSGMRPVIEVALRAVLPDHDARTRADERAKVAEEIAEMGGEPAGHGDWGRGWADAIKAAIHVARCHANPPTGEDT